MVKTRGRRWAYIAHLIYTGVINRNIDWKICSKLGHQCANKALLRFNLVTYFLTGPTHIHTFPRYYQYKHSEQV